MTEELRGWRLPTEDDVRAETADLSGQNGAGTTVEYRRTEPLRIDSVAVDEMGRR